MRPVRLIASASLAAATALGLATSRAQSILPTQGVVTSGAASIRQSGADLSITQTSPRAIVNWGRFSIGQGNGVTFNQPSASSAILNRVTGTDDAPRSPGSCRPTVRSISSTRTGSRSPGPALFGSAAASSPRRSGIADSDFNSGNLSFAGNGASAGVVNAGSIEAAPGGFVGLIGGTVVEFGRRLRPARKGRDGLGRAGDAEPDRRQFPAGRRADEHEDGRRPGADRRLRQGARRGRIGAAQGGDGREGDPQRGQRAGRALRRFGPRERRLDHSQRRRRRKRRGDRTARRRRAGRKGGAIAISGHDVALHRAKLVASSAKGRGGSVDRDRNERGQPGVDLGRRLRRDRRRRHSDRRRFPWRKRSHVGSDDDDRIRPRR